MGVDFMTGATLFALVNLVGIAFVVLVGYRIWTKVSAFVKSGEDKTLNIKWELIVFALIIFFGIFAGSVMRPKVTIDVPINRELKQYQNNNQEIVIETPAPRTEKLDGFKPLGE